MLNKLIEKALSLRLAVLGLAAILAGIGAWSFANLPIDAFPDISTTQVKIILKAPGMTPEEVESRVVTPIEMEMLGIPEQTVLRSVAKYAIADITIDFEDSTDIYWARQQVAERLNAAMGDLPPTVEGGLAPISTPLSEMFMFTLEGPQSPRREAPRARLDDPPGPAHGARSCRCQRAGRLCRDFRSRSAQCGARGRGALHRRPCRRDRDEQSQRWGRTPDQR
jgi:Cu/Ag efflux pump CusA